MTYLSEAKARETEAQRELGLLNKGDTVQCELANYDSVFQIENISRPDLTVTLKVISTGQKSEYDQALKTGQTFTFDPIEEATMWECRERFGERYSIWLTVNAKNDVHVTFIQKAGGC